MTDRIYYIEPSRTTFDATVIRAFEHEGHPAVALDRTAFYPTSGGQPFDTGRLGSARVLDCIEADDEIVHVLDTPLPQGASVRGDIDWERRFDHMQQHTGQHVLSAAFDRLFDNRTMSFHMGADSSTIDLAREVTASEVVSAVAEANRIVWDDREVRVRFVSPEEAAQLPLRKDPTRTGTLRLIEVDDFDLSACGGTHVARTGQIGIIVVAASERFRGGSRLTFACGRRAEALFNKLRDAVAGSIRVLSVLPDELPTALEKLQTDAKGLRKTVSRLQGELAGHEADRLVREATESDGVRVITRTVDGWDAGGLKAIASTMTKQSGVAVALLSTQEPLAVAVARSPGIAVDASKVLRTLLERFGGKGGGKPDLAQGAGLAGAPADIVAFARQLFLADLKPGGSN